MKFKIDIFNRARDAYAVGHEPEGRRLLSDIYWRTILVAALLILVCVFLYGTWVLMRVLDDLGATADVSAPPPPALSRAMLKEMVQGFEMRQSQFETMKKSPPAAIPDPSR
ncbi:MAG: hypothetical protein Q7S50_02585 [bacterium]|nr:hypothetical protein [bacterium]